jgi:FkbM family methyltransferase
VNTALSDKVGNVPMHRSRINVGATRVGVGEDLVHYTAPAITIDMLAPPKSKLSISLIHLDVEGYEKSILMGGLKEIERCKPVIVLETWDDEFMKSIGYRDAGMVSPWDKAFVYNS